MDIQAVTDKTVTRKTLLKRDLYFYLGVVILLILCFSFFSPFYQRFMTEVMIFGILAMSLDFLLGMVGLLNLGHALFFGLNMYLFVYFYQILDWPFLFALILSFVLTFMLATIVGYFSCRLTGIQFAMVTLAFGQLFHTIAIKARGFTGGSDGIRLSKTTEIGLGSWTLSMMDTNILLFMSSVLLIITYYVLNRLKRSYFGNAMSAIRINEERAKFLGFDVFLVKLQAFVISAVFCGLAGVIYILLKGYASPELVHWSFSGDVLLMTLLGGMGTLIGPLGGAMVLTWFKDFISSYTDNWMMIMGALFIAIVLFMPKGVFGWFLKER